MLMNEAVIVPYIVLGIHPKQLSLSFISRQNIFSIVLQFSLANFGYASMFSILSGVLPSIYVRTADLPTLENIFE